MKGIILAGGSATRFRPASLAVSKQLMPVFDKPAIYYSLTTLMLAGIREVLLISSPTDLPQYKKLFLKTMEWGIEMDFAEQINPGGVAEALIIGESFINSNSVALILGDNLFHGKGLGRDLREAFNSPGALIGAYQVADSKSFGVVEFNEEGVVISIEEKPQIPKSNWAVPGIYFYDNSASYRTKLLKRSGRGELEITDLNRSYLDDNLLKVKILPRGTTWLDMGDSQSLLEAANYVMAIQERQGLLIGSPEEASWRAGWISSEKLLSLAHENRFSNYGRYLTNLVLGQ